MTSVAPRTRRWRRVEYERLIECGILPTGEPVELMDGNLVVAEPQGSGHFAAVRAVEEALRPAFGTGWEIRAQGPLALDDESEPEPDVAVVTGSFRDYVAEHPSQPVLVVEVSESSLALDREHKGSLYARAGIPDYWILNLVDEVLEVRRLAAPDSTAPFGWGYRSVEMLSRGSAVSPLARPGSSVRVIDLFP